MSANTEPRFIKTPKVWGASLRPAVAGPINLELVKETTTSSSTYGVNAVDLIATAGTFGTRVDQITVAYAGDITAATIVRFYIDKAGTKRIVLEVSMPLYTATNGAASTVATRQGTNGLPLFILESGDKLQCVVAHGTAATQASPLPSDPGLGFEVHAIGGDF